MQKRDIIVNMKSAIDIILREPVRNVFNHFAASFGVVVVFYSVDGRILQRGLDQPVSDYCRLVREHLYGSGGCSLSDENMCRECARSRQAVSYRCHAGIEEAVAPVYSGSQLAGYAMIGQFRCEHNPDPKVVVDARAAGVEKELFAAFARLPFYDQSRKRHLLGLFAVLADYIIARELVSVSGDRVVARVMAYVEQHIDRPIRLAAAAKAVGRSASLVSHQFTAVLGQSFSEAVISAKLNRAEEYFRQSPELSIGEVAERLGYRDQLYFSRLYRKYRGIPPSEFRKAMAKLKDAADCAGG